MTRMMNGDDDYRSMIPCNYTLSKKQEKKGCLKLFSSPNYKSDIFSKNHVSVTARKIGVTFIWWFTLNMNEN